MKYSFAILCVSALPCAALTFEENPMPRVELNAPASDFSLPDFNGEQFSLSALLDKKNVVIVFNRGFL